MTQYEAIMKHLRKHGSATVRDLMRYSNCPWKRIDEMTSVLGTVANSYRYRDKSWEQIDRLWTTRNGKKVRLYKLVRVK